MSWFEHLSWSHALLLVLSVLIALAVLGMAIYSRFLDGSIARDLDELTPWPVIDYSAQRQKQVEWLGARYLLHKPINRTVKRRQNVATLRPRNKARA